MKSLGHIQGTGVVRDSRLILAPLAFRVGSSANKRAL